MDFTNRKIIQIIEENGITPSKFADDIGVQRPIISHILAGRNKPSLDIILKINKWNPSYTLDYFAEPNKEDVQNSSDDLNYKSFMTSKESQYKDSELNRIKMMENTPKFSIEKNQQGADSGKQVERILIFYSDKTFSEYRPA